MPSEVPYPDLFTQRLIVNEAPDLGTLFHRLNNQLGIILANAELLVAKAHDDGARARATQIVTSAIDAIGTAQDIRARTRHGSEE
jgi:hypothetical protein